MKSSIDKGMILSIASNSDVFTRGQNYYSEGKVRELESRQEKDTRYTKAVVTGNYKNYEVNLLFEAGGRIKGYKCSCESHSIWRGACKHVVAALFAMMQDNPLDYEQARMTALARNVADTFETQIISEIERAYTAEADSGRFFLEPILHVSSENANAELELLVGEKKPYNIKNIPELLGNIRKNETVSYGKRLTFQHSLSAFDSDSQKLIHFLEKENQIYTAVGKSFVKRFGYYTMSRENPRFVPLSAHNLDDFFALYTDKSLRLCIDHLEPTPVRCTGLMPEVRFDIDCQRDVVTLRGQVDDVVLLTGENYGYLIIKESAKMSRSGSIHRLPKSRAEMLSSICKGIHATRGRIAFTSRDAGRFLTMVYPFLKKAGLVGDVTGELAQMPQAELLPKLYFDSDGKDVSCSVRFCYDDEELDPLRPNDIQGLRDMAEELRVIRMLNGMGFDGDNDKGLYMLKDDEMIYEFLHRDLDSLHKSAEIYVTDELRKKELKAPAKGFGVRIEGNLLELSAHEWDFSLHDLMEAMESYHTKKTFHRLRDGRFIPLDNEETQAAAALVDSLDLSKKDVRSDAITLPRFRAMYLDAITQGDSARFISKEDSFQKLTEGFKNFQDMTFSVPSCLENVLRDYQKTGFQWLKMLARYGFGGILADDMGLGKTIQAIALLVSEKQEDHMPAPSLVVSPTSLIYNWEKEIARFAPMLRTQVVSGPAAHRAELIAEHGDVDVFITTYDMLKRDLPHYREQDMQFAYVIADEAQYIKNPLTQNAKAVKSIGGRVRFALTGTPMENALSELWSEFDFVMPGYLHSQSKFSRLYETPIVKDDNRDKADLLRKQTAPFILRRVKSEVLRELPAKTETILYAEMHADQRKLYMANLLKARGELEQVLDEGLYEQSRIKILAQLTRLRQICCHPALFVDNYKGGSGKLELAVETVQRSVDSGHRLLMFSQFTSMLRILQDALTERGISYFYLDGATDAKERNEMTERFNLGERDSFLISLKAGGTGLNLTGADVVIHYDPWWNPAVMDQASDRAHRYGQKRAVQVFNLVAKDSIEEKILTLQSKKRDLIDTVITEGASFLNKMSPEDVRELFTT